MGQNIKLSEARALTPAPTGAIGEWARSLREAAFDAVSESDIADIMKKQVEKAKAGDARAASFVTGFLCNVPKSVTIINQPQPGRLAAASTRRDDDDHDDTIDRMNANQRIRNGLDPETITDPAGHPFWFPSPHLIGTPEYHAIQTARIDAGLPAEHPDDPKPAIEAPKKKRAI